MQNSVPLREDKAVKPGGENFLRQLRTAQCLNWITAVAAAVALGGLWLIHRNIVEANRAWVAPGTPTLTHEPAIGQPVRVSFPWDNLGREPATELKISIFFDVLKSQPGHSILSVPNITENTCDKYPPYVDLGVTFPAKSASFDAATSQQAITWDAALESGDQLLRARGCISYVTFGTRHYSWFCTAFTGKLKNADIVRTSTSCPYGSGAN
jgi:hypothetical protein